MPAPSNSFLKSQKAFSKAKKILVGGVNSPVRSFQNVNMNPFFVQKAQGSKIYDIDQNEYIDFVGSWGPMILGHAHPHIIQSIQKIASYGLSFGAPSLLENQLAEKIISLIPWIDKIRFVSSGTEATMSAVRLARGFTEKYKIIQFQGAYHGHADHFLIQAGSGNLTLGTPNSKGIPQNSIQNTLIAQFNHIDSVKQLLLQYKNQIAAVIIEPIPGNMGCIPPKIPFLQQLRTLCSENHIILIFDEVMTGFRVSPGGAQQLFNITPDLICLGKIIGGGFPVGAFAGKNDIMNYIAPEGPVYQAGTLSGNPVAMKAGLETLKLLSQNQFYQNLETISSSLEYGIRDNLKNLNLNLTLNRVGSMFSLFFTDKKVIDFHSANTSNKKLFSSYFKIMLHKKIFLPPSQFESAFISSAHTQIDIQNTIQLNYEALKTLFD